jgi:hypothetical protein
MSENRPSFIITIDTEGDDLWSRPRLVTTRNAEFLLPFQELCESFGLRPTYLTNHEMALTPAFIDLGRNAVWRGVAEIGMHLHAWDSPPHVPLTDDDVGHHPYLTEYPVTVMRDKVRAQTMLLEDVFGVPIRSHRAGRWSLDERYAGILIEEGYVVDCSVTPHVSWRANKGDPRGNGGADYIAFPEAPYFIDPLDIRRPGSSPLLEVPVTVMRQPRSWRVAERLLSASPSRSLFSRALGRLMPPIRWLRPNGRNRADLLDIVHAVVSAGRSHAEFMLHSSELMPGGSPTFRDHKAIDRLYGDLRAVFALAARTCRPATLTEFHTWLTTGRIAEWPLASSNAASALYGRALPA